MRLDLSRRDPPARCGRIAAAATLAVCLAAGCYDSREGPADADATLSDSLDDVALPDDAFPPDDAGSPDEAESFVDVAPPDETTPIDDAGSPDEVETPDASDAADELPGDAPWSPDGSGAECTVMLEDTCPLPERCDRSTCDPFFGRGACVVPPEECPPWDDPVCGCDRTTYGNDCLRMLAGQARKHEGACVPGEDPPFCIVDPFGMSCWTVGYGCLHGCCPGCDAECRDDGLETEGWYPACDPFARESCYGYPILLENCM